MAEATCKGKTKKHHDDNVLAREAKKVMEELLDLPRKTKTPAGNQTLSVPISLAFDDGRTVSATLGWTGLTADDVTAIEGILARMC